MYGVTIISSRAYASSVNLILEFLNLIRSLVTLTLIDLKPRYEKKRVSFTFASISNTPSLLLIVPTTELRFMT